MEKCKKFTKSPGIAAGSDSGRPSPLADSCNRRKLAIWARSRAADCREPLMIERSPAASECGFAPCPPAAKRQSLHLRSDSQGAGAAARHIGPGHRCAPAGRRRGGVARTLGYPAWTQAAVSAANSHPAPTAQREKGAPRAFSSGYGGSEAKSDCVKIRHSCPWSRQAQRSSGAVPWRRTPVRWVSQ